MNPSPAVLTARLGKARLYSPATPTAAATRRNVLSNPSSPNLPLPNNSTLNSPTVNSPVATINHRIEYSHKREGSCTLESLNRVKEIPTSSKLLKAKHSDLSPTIHGRKNNHNSSDGVDDGFYNDTDTHVRDNTTNTTNILTDGFSRRLTYLRLSITDFCNFRCGYCLPNGYQGRRPDDELTLAEIETLTNAFAQVGTQKVRITGGEPSIRSDVTAIIETIKHTKGIKTVAMTSNGYKLGKHIQHWQQAGLNQLNISVDSFDATTFQQMTGFDILPQLLRDMDKLLATTDIKLKINGILMAKTAYETLIAALDYVKTRPVTYRFIEFMQTSDNSDLFFAQHAQSDLIIKYLLSHGWQPQSRGVADGPAIEYSHPDYIGRIGMIAPYAAHFCDSCNRLRVSSLGKVHLCLFDQGNHDIRDYLRNNDVDGLIEVLHDFMPIKPEHHHLSDANSGMMRNLSMIGG